MKPRILVVEDDLSNADVIQQMLELEDFEVESINRHGLIGQSIKRFSPDLIIMDILLHKGDGRLLCNSSKKTRVQITFQYCLSPLCSNEKSRAFHACPMPSCSNRSITGS